MMHGTMKLKKKLFNDLVNIRLKSLYLPVLNGIQYLLGAAVPKNQKASTGVI